MNLLRRSLAGLAGLSSLAGLALAAACATPPDLRGARAGPDERTLRVVTFNVHYGEALLDERDGNRRSISRTFLAHPALRGVDILALQEVCAGDGGWQLAYFDQMVDGPAGSSKMAVARSDPSDEGLPCERVEAIVSRYPIVAQGVLQLPQLFEPRSAVWADIAIGDPQGARPPTLVRVYNAHLENKPRGDWTQGRLVQMKAILAHVEAWRSEHPGSPVILLGDFNTNGHGWDYWRREPLLEALDRHHFRASLEERRRTLTLLPHALDWIYFDGLHLRGSKVVHVWLSDHFPVVADFELPGPSRPILGAAQGPGPSSSLRSH